MNRPRSRLRDPSVGRVIKTLAQEEIKAAVRVILGQDPSALSFEERELLMRRYPDLKEEVLRVAGL